MGGGTSRTCSVTMQNLTVGRPNVTNFQCTPAENFYNDGYGTYQLLLLVDSDNVFTIRPFPTTETGLSFTLTYFPGENRIVASFVVNALPPEHPNNDPLSLTFTMIKVPMTYTFRYDPSVPVNKKMFITMSYSPSFPRIKNDDIMNDNPVIQPIFPPIDICDLNQIPRIIITSLDTDIVSRGFSTLAFSVFDTVKYNGYYCDSKLICPTEHIYQTDFLKYPQFQTVVKGHVCKNDRCSFAGTLRQKMGYLIKVFDIPFDRYDFMGLLGFYASARYILSGLLYQDFNVKWLLEKYYKKFLKDLADSRFCRFAIIFTNSEPEINFIGYEKYFLFGSKKCENKRDVCGNIEGCRTVIRPHFT